MRIVVGLCLTIFLVLSLTLYLGKLSTLNNNTILNKYEVCDKFQDLGSKQKCWEDLIEETLGNEGLESAFNLVDYLYTNEPIFASDCHGFTHQLGVKAYQLFSQNQNIKLTSKASYCGFGFYHAFMESLLHATGDLNQARQFCDYVGKQASQNELSRLSCFHGIGHGLLEDVPNPTVKSDAQTIIKRPLEICVQLSKSEVEEYRCTSGVFNVLAIYYQNQKTGLKIQNNDPYLICQNQNKKYPKKACYDQMNSLVLSLAAGNLSLATRFAEKITDDEFADEAIHGIAGAYGQTKVDKINYDDVVKICQNIQPRLTLQCLQGFLLGMLEGGKPGEEYIEGRKFCTSNLLREEEKISCFNDLVWNTSVTNPKKLAEICNGLEQKYKQNCNAN